MLYGWPVPIVALAEVPSGSKLVESLWDPDPVFQQKDAGEGSAEWNRWR